jgi:hypothetical protein
MGHPVFAAASGLASEYEASRRLVKGAGAADEVLGGAGPFGEDEFEACVEEGAGEDAAALEDEFGFGLEGDGADGEHPFCGGEAEAGAVGVTQGAHEV